MPWVPASVTKGLNNAGGLVAGISSHIETKWLTFNGKTSIFVFLNVTCILIQISLKFVPKGPFGVKLTLVEIRAWDRPSDKPLSQQ